MTSAPVSKRMNKEVRKLVKQLAGTDISTAFEYPLDSSGLGRTAIKIYEEDVDFIVGKLEHPKCFKTFRLKNVKYTAKKNPQINRSVYRVNHEQQWPLKLVVNKSGKPLVPIGDDADDILAKEIEQILEEFVGSSMTDRIILSRTTVRVTESYAMVNPRERVKSVLVKMNDERIDNIEATAAEAFAASKRADANAAEALAASKRTAEDVAELKKMTVASNNKSDQALAGVEELKSQQQEMISREDFDAMFSAAYDRKKQEERASKNLLCAKKIKSWQLN